MNTSESMAAQRRMRRRLKDLDAPLPMVVEPQPNECGGLRLLSPFQQGSADAYCTDCPPTARSDLRFLQVFFRQTCRIRHRLRGAL
jgi:hypothetical protein